jgi:hypothetical protein
MLLGKVLKFYVKLVEAQKITDFMVARLIITHEPKILS